MRACLSFCLCRCASEENCHHEANLPQNPGHRPGGTNCDPRNVDYVIPSNDDAIRPSLWLQDCRCRIEGKLTQKNRQKSMSPQVVMTGVRAELTDESCWDAAPCKDLSRFNVGGYCELVPVQKS